MKLKCLCDYQYSFWQKINFRRGEIYEVRYLLGHPMVQDRFGTLWAISETKSKGYYQLLAAGRTVAHFQEVI